MDLNALKNQLINDLKASWRKSALLALLLVFGLTCWIPQLLRAVAGRPSIPPVAPVAVAASPRPAEPAPASAAAAAPVAAPVDATAAEFSWERGERLLQTDPLVRSVEVAALRGDPFRIDRDQFPPPLLFEEEPIKQSALAPKPVVNDKRLAERLVLKSTIVGLRRRAAFINDKLYYEGREIQVDGETFLLTAVHPRRVLLTQGAAVFELVIANKFARETLGAQ